MVAKIVNLNENQKLLAPNSYWEGLKDEEGLFVGCGTCIGEVNSPFDVNNPELCNCGQNEQTNEQFGASVRVTGSFMKELRKRGWWDKHRGYLEDQKMQGGAAGFQTS